MKLPIKGGPHSTVRRKGSYEGRTEDTGRYGMANSDCMLGNAEASGRGLVPFRGGYIHLNDLLATAVRLQDEATKAKACGEHERAVELYQELLPHVQLLEEFDAFKLPQGLPTQQVQRAIEIEEGCLQSPHD